MRQKQRSPQSFLRKRGVRIDVRSAPPWREALVLTHHLFEGLEFVCDEGRSLILELCVARLKG